MRTKMLFAGLAIPAIACASPMTTEWGEKTTSENAHRYYPRPQMERPSWQCLNGDWDYAVTKVIDTPGRPAKWDGKIRVPFPIESSLSGVGRLLEPDEFLWYTRKIKCDKRPGERILLHFGGVDFRTMVFIGHKEVTQVPHEGGQNPFSYDITDFVKDGENELTLQVWDPTEKFVNSRGKQCFKSHSCFYTRVSGVWQTVWMENVPAKYISSYRVTTDIDKGEAVFTFDVAGLEYGDSAEGRIEVDLDGGKTASASFRPGERAVVKMPAGFKLWSPESPTLYDFKARFGKDEIKGYFGMRKIEKRCDAKGILRFFLNNKPYYMMGILDQGWWPDGLLTPPSIEAMAYDIKVLKDCGFNTLRKHIKVEPLAYYALCDRMGILVIQDLPSGSDSFKDPRRWETVARYTLQRQEMKEMMDALYNVPSIVMWNPYNEGWSQPCETLTHSMLDFTRDYDPTRLVNGPSGAWDWEGGHLLPKGWGWKDRVWSKHKPEGECEAGDAVDLHLYFGPDMFPVNDRRVSFLGEFGGFGHLVKGHLWKEPKNGKGNLGYDGSKGTATREGLEKAYLGLMDKLEQLAAKGLGGSIYTQTSDVEVEFSGILTYDRKVLKFNPEVLRKRHEQIIRRAEKEASGKIGDPVPFGTTKYGEKATLYTLAGKGGLEMQVTDDGGKIVRLLVPDAKGEKIDVTVGFDSPAGWETTDAYFGAIIGRFGNRIAEGKFKLDGKDYQVPVNDKANSAALHGGNRGWDAYVWKAEPFAKGDDIGIVFTKDFPDGEQGFPGAVKAKVTYTITPGNVWRIEYEATTDKATPINLTHHVYFNMDGEGTVLDQELMIAASKFLPIDKNLAPVGDPAPVAGTPLDFREFHKVGERIDAPYAILQFDPGYNHNWCLDGSGFRKAAELRGKARAVEVWTDQPGLQCYTGNFISDAWKMKDGKPMRRRGWLALETQHYPNSPNRPDFPSTILRPGETYRTKTEYRFRPAPSR